MPSRSLGADHSKKALHARLLLIIMLTLMLVSCGDGGSAHDDGSPVPPDTAPEKITPNNLVASPSISTAAVSGHSQGCTADETDQLVQRFVNAFNQGDQAQLANLFPDDSVQNDVGVTRYSIVQQDDPGFATDSRVALLSALADRHSRNQQWEIRELDINASGSSASVSFALTAQGDGMPLRTFEGKGRVDCMQGWITIWHMTDHGGSGSSPEEFAIPVVLPTTLPTVGLNDLDPTNLGESCGPQEGALLVQRFIDAFNQADQVHLATFLPKQSEQFAFAVQRSDGSSWSTEDPTEGLEELLWRSQRHEQWQSRRIAVDSETHGAVIQFRLMMQADGVPLQTLVGEGVINCEQQQIVRWVMAEQLK